MPNPVKGVPRLFERTHTGRLHAVKTTRASIADRRAGPHTGRHEPFLLEPLECGVYCARGDVAFESGLYVPQNRSTVGSVAEPEHGEEDGLFKSTENICHLCLHCRLSGREHASWLLDALDVCRPSPGRSRLSAFDASVTPSVFSRLTRSVTDRSNDLN